MIIIASHFVRSGNTIYQPLVDNLELFFEHKKRPYQTISHSLNGDFSSSLKKEDGTMVTFLPKIGFGPLRYIVEIFGTVVFLIFHLFSRRKETMYFIGIDPLNALIGIFLRFFFRRTQVIFYIPDYSPTRFASGFLNSLYHSIESFVSTKADRLWCVSRPVFEMKQKINQNVTLLHNYAPRFLIPENISPEKNTLCMAGLLEDYYMFDELVEAVMDMGKPYSCHIIGGGSRQEDYRRRVQEKNASSIIFDGFIPKSQFFQHLSTYEIGLALYSNNQEFNRYGDSVKCRDYIALGIPIITTDNHATAKDIETYELGYVIKSRSTDIAREIQHGIRYIQKNSPRIQENIQKYYSLTYVLDEILETIY